MRLDNYKDLLVVGETYFLKPLKIQEKDRIYLTNDDKKFLIIDLPNKELIINQSVLEYFEETREEFEDTYIYSLTDEDIAKVTELLALLEEEC